MCLYTSGFSAGETDFSDEIEVSERFADGQSSIMDLRNTRAQLGARGGYSAAWAENNAFHAVLEDEAFIAASRAVFYHAAFFYFFTMEQKTLTGTGRQEAALAAREAEQKELTSVVRDIFANPFRRALPTQTIPEIVYLAREAYDDRSMPSGILDNARLSALADLLEEAGCQTEGLLAHLRSLGPKYRGSWSLDLVLGKL
jgi:hypothetical protein